jgi:hypothetical protein
MRLFLGAAPPLYRDAGRIAKLDPDAVRAGSIGAIDLLRHDARGAKPAGIGEHGRPIFGNVFVKPDASLGIVKSRASADFRSRNGRWRRSSSSRSIRSNA